MTKPALLLTGADPSHQDRCIAKVLQFFGVASRNLTTAEFEAANVSDAAPSDKFRLLCSADILLRIFRDLERDGGEIPGWRQHVHSAFVYAGEDFETLQKLARIVTGDDEACLQEVSPSIGDLVVSEEAKDFCGAMAGMRVAASRANTGASSVLRTGKGNALISFGQGAMFLKAEYKGVVICLSTCKRIINLDAKPGSRTFDVRDNFLSAVPIVLYTRWAFGNSCWKAPETNACLVIDDPCLKLRYCWLKFDELFALMERHHFSTNIAFIPWNWRRSKPKVAKLFRQKPDYCSLSIHGSDHIAEEFGSTDREHLRWKTAEAINRMSGHETRTGIRHERIMVFPQGIFSTMAMDVLKHFNFTAAVNSEIISADPHRQAITISDLWDVAVMRYGCFPMFTRRDPFQGIENFAFDILLGKPCLVAVHHDFCRDEYKHLLAFIHRLNRLNCRLSWRSLGEAIKRSYRQRELSLNLVEIQMYAAELLLENSSAESKRCLVRRHECDPSAIREASADSDPVVWKSADDCINFEIELSPGERKMISIKFHEPAENGYPGRNVPYRLRTMVRRYLSELRDNYVMKDDMRFRP